MLLGPCRVYTVAHGWSVLCHVRDRREHGCEGKRPGPETHAVMLLVPRTDKGQAGLLDSEWMGSLREHVCGTRRDLRGVFC